MDAFFEPAIWLQVSAEQVVPCLIGYAIGWFGIWRRVFIGTGNWVAHMLCMGLVMGTMTAVMMLGVLLFGGQVATEPGALVLFILPALTATCVMPIWFGIWRAVFPPLKVSAARPPPLPVVSKPAIPPPLPDRSSVSPSHNHCNFDAEHTALSGMYADGDLTLSEYLLKFRELVLVEARLEVALASRAQIAEMMQRTAAQ